VAVEIIIDSKLDQIGTFEELVESILLLEAGNNKRVALT